jgi:transcriptional activator SPT8
LDDTLRDADDGGNDNEADADADADQDADSQSNASHASDSAAPQQNTDVEMTAPGQMNIVHDSISMFHPPVRPECLTASTYDIVPTTAAPHGTSINAVTATADMRWVFSGGSDGYVRKFNWVDSVNSKLMLTVAQRHPFVDSVIKAGVVMTYWENMDGNTISPVYSLASHSEGLWLLSGLESGAIRLQSVRHDEGKEIALLQQHTSAVSVLNLTSDEKSLLSGSWDKRVFDWDLNTGQTRRVFGSSAGQISAIDIRPESSLPIPKDSDDTPLPNGTYSSNYQTSGGDGFNFMDTSNEQGGIGDSSNPQAGSPADSLFGGADSLFGDADGAGGEGAGASENAFGIDEDDEFGKALANGTLPDADAHGEPEPAGQQNGAPEVSAPVDTSVPNTGENTAPQQAELHEPEAPSGSSQPLVNGLPHAEALEPVSQSQDLSQQPQSNKDISDNTFLAASIDGTIRVWDRRQPDPVARITPRNSPPWCMNACWSPDGNYIYAGRRNGTVEEFSLHKGLRGPERIFKFPQGSGPVTALRAMPNGRHIVW